MHPKETQTLLITGANGHLGTTVTRHFLEEGFRVIATVSGQQAVDSLPKHERLFPFAVDLADEAATADFIRQCISDHHHIDAALLLAGGFAMGSIAETTSAAIKEQLELNFNTAFHVVRPLLAHMQERESGRIIFIGAKPALEPATGKDMLAYTLSKSLLFRLAESINESTRGTNITASVIVPGTIDTAANRAAMPGADTSKWVKPEDLSAIMSFIISEKSGALRDGVFKTYNGA